MESPVAPVEQCFHLRIMDHPTMLAATYHALAGVRFNDFEDDLQGIDRMREVMCMLLHPVGRVCDNALAKAVGRTRFISLLFYLL